MTLPALASLSYAVEKPVLIERHDGFVDSGGVLIYYETIGRGPPLMVLHGGPGASHDYFLPYLLPLARQHRLVFIDERGCGRSQRLTDARQYTLNGMVQDAEAVRLALDLGRMDLLGHSFGGILAQAYAIAHPSAVRRLILAGTGSTAKLIDEDFARIKSTLDPKLLQQINAVEARGIFEPSGAQTQEYRKLADEAELPFNYHVRPPSWDSSDGPMGWDVLREMWVRKSDFTIDGNLKGFDFTPDLQKLMIPTLIIYGDHDLVSPATARQTHGALRHSQIVEVKESGHNTFIDQTEIFVERVSTFLGS